MRRFLFPALLLGFLLWGCALPAAKQTANPSSRVAANGDIIWQGEYQFAPAPKGWLLVPPHEADTSFVYVKLIRDKPLCETSFGYSEEPFGVSRDLHQRMEEFYRRFLWAGRVTFDPPKSRPVTVFGRAGLEATSLGRNRVRGQKVWTKVILARRGERIVAFFMTQWQSQDGKFDPADEKVFQHFVDSFHFLKPSFYQTL